MIKILINSYTCCPGMGSEQGMGWNWITSLVKTGEVELFVITEGEYRLQIEKTLSCSPLKGEGVNENGLTADQIANLHFYWNPIGGDDEARCEEIRKMCWNQGDWRFYKYYREWQLKTAEIAMEICRKEKIDILHQLNMIGFREPGYLWQVSKETGIPLVWGPVDAKDKFPMAYTEGTSIKTKAFLWLKNVISIWQLKYSSRVRKTARQASVLLGASSNSVESFKKYMGVDAALMNETGCFVETNTKRTNNTNEHELGCKTKSDAMGNIREISEIPVHKKLHKPLNLLWVGKMDFRKQLGLAIRTVATAWHEDVRLHVVGGGDATPYKLMVERLGIMDNVVWHGSVSHDEVQKLMQECDVMLFTSVAEGTPHVVLEAIANGLPVICHNTCGHGDSVIDKVGIKIPLSNPEQSVKDFAAAIERIYKNRELLSKMSENCKARAEELSWENKALEMVELYKSSHLPASPQRERS